MKTHIIRARSPRTLALAAAGAALVSVATAAYAYTQDVDSRGQITNISGGLRFTIFQRTSSTPGRAELRGTSTRTSTSASGRFRLVSGGKFVSIMQILNVREAGATSGGAEPITQLGVRLKSGSTNRYEFYIVQGGQLCSGTPTIVPGTDYTVSVAVSNGQVPEYKINGISCKKSNPDGDKAGTIYDGGQLQSGRYFYPKMGAYNTQSNQTQNGGDSVIEWRNIAIP